MAKGEKPSHEVFVTTKNGDKTFYHKIGAIWPVANGGLSIQLHAAPLDGRAVAFPPKED